MKSQQLYHGLYGRRNVQQRDPRGFARQVLVNAQQGADAGAVEEFHGAQVDGDGFDSRLPESLELALEVPRGGRIKPCRFHHQVKCLIFQFSLNDDGHVSQHVVTGRAGTPQKLTHEVSTSI